MHLYENAERSVYAWNAVDVEVNGQLQHGHVIGLEENDSAPSRLIVDFGCPSKRAVQVPYGMIWDCSDERSSSDTVGAPVEVLLHNGADEAWKWCPGKILIGCLNHLKDMALVEVTMGESSRRELLPRRQIRESPGDAVKSQLLTAGHFVVRTCSVPNGYWALQPSIAAFLLRQVEKNLKLRFVTVLSQTMLYVSRSHGSRSRDENGLIGIVFERERVVRAFDEKLRERHEELENDCEKGLISEVQDCELKHKKPLVVDERGLALHLGVLKEIFLSLDTIDRQRCRRTCSLWEAILTSPELVQELRALHQQPSPSSRVKLESNYALYACIFKHLTPATRTICIRDTETVFLWDDIISPGAKEAIDFMKKHLNQPGLRIRRFILQQQSIKFPERKLSVLATQIIAHLSKQLSYSDRVIWKDCEFKLLDKYRCPLMQSRIPAAVFTRGHFDAARIVDLLETHLRWNGQRLEEQRVTHFMANPIGSTQRAQEVQKILHEYQSCDPRPSQYRNHQWTRDNLASVDVGKLNRLCRYALWRHIDDWPG